MLDAMADLCHHVNRRQRLDGCPEAMVLKNNVESKSEANTSSKGVSQPAALASKELPAQLTQGSAKSTMKNEMTNKGPFEKWI